MLETDSKSEIQIQTVDESDEYTTVFFVFDSVLKNSGMESRAAVDLFKNIQSQSLQ
ncbi:MAG: hypothetical protein KGY66_08420 [Candidatus Thermoplasmatota archaeon]|nr:hypothetical protein [Candidatus Thermoplasmatota archaeon]MBS3790920.1 hypothetical protein [Candidatus Thermoplasmatota archaeon]